MAKDFINMSMSVDGEQGTAGFTRKISAAVKEYKDPRKLWWSLSADFFDYEEEGWDKANIVHSWGDLADSTIESKTRRNLPQPAMPLVARGTLRDALTRYQGDPSQIHILNKNEFSVGVNLQGEDAGKFYHMTGARRGEWRLPRRPFMPTAPIFIKEAKVEQTQKKWQDRMAREIFFNRKPV